MLHSLQAVMMSWDDAEQCPARRQECAAISNTCAVQLPEYVIKSLQEGVISEGHGRAC